MQIKASSAPEEDTQVSGAEREYVMANTVSSATTAAPEGGSGGGGHFAPPMGNASAIPWKLLLSRKEVRFVRAASAGWCCGGGACVVCQAHATSLPSCTEVAAPA